MPNCAGLHLLRHLLRLCLGLSAIVASSTLAPAYTAEPMRVAGTILRSDAHVLTLKTVEQAMQAIKLNAQTKFVKRHPANLNDVTADSFIGVTAVEGDNGKLVAREIHLFPESMRGAGEGHHPMIGTDEGGVTTMTNGNITTMTNGTVGANGAAGKPMTLSIAYQGGTSEIEVLGDVPVTQMTPADASVLRPGFPAVAYVRPDTDGRPVAITIIVTKPK